MHAKKLAERMQEDAGDLGIIREISETLVPQLQSLVELLDQAQLETKPKDFADRTRRKLGLTGSALQTLAGSWLPAIYKRHFNREAGSSRPPCGGPPEGPYIRFAVEVLDAFGVDCTRETIHAAIYMVKSAKKIFDLPF
jgi:hypothetical protein